MRDNGEAKSVVAGRFISNFKNNVYKYLTSITKNADIEELDDIFHECNNTYHRTIKIKPADVKSDKSINSNVENDYKDTKIKFSDHVRTSKYKKFLQKTVLEISPKKFLRLKKLIALHHGNM